MNALILTAGLGVRLRPLTNKVPKNLIEIEGEPILSHVISHIKQVDVESIIVNLHYKPIEFMKYFDYSLLYTYEPELLGEEKTIEMLGRYFPFIRNDYLLVANGDTLTNLDIEKMFDFARGRNIRSMDNGVYTGTKIVTPDYFLGLDRNFVNYYQADIQWVDCGTPEGLEKGKEFVKNEKANYLRQLQDTRN